MLVSKYEHWSFAELDIDLRSAAVLACLLLSSSVHAQAAHSAIRFTRTSANATAACSSATAPCLRVHTDGSLHFANVGAGVNDFALGAGGSTFASLSEDTGAAKLITSYIFKSTSTSLPTDDDAAIFWKGGIARPNSTLLIGDQTPSIRLGDVGALTQMAIYAVINDDVRFEIASDHVIQVEDANANGAPSANGRDITLRAAAGKDADASNVAGHGGKTTIGNGNNGGNGSVSRAAGAGGNVEIVSGNGGANGGGGGAAAGIVKIVAGSHTNASGRADIQFDGVLHNLTSAQESTTVGASGGASNTPAAPAKYLIIKLSDGNTYKLPLYNP